jgi:hypothetical protein
VVCNSRKGAANSLTSSQSPRQALDDESGLDWERVKEGQASLASFVIAGIYIAKPFIKANGASV